MAGFIKDLLGAGHEHLYVDNRGGATLGSHPEGGTIGDAALLIRTCSHWPSRAAGSNEPARRGGRVAAYMGDVHTSTRPCILPTSTRTEYWARAIEPNSAAAEALGAIRTPELLVLEQALPTGPTGEA